VITFTIDFENHRQDRIARYERPVRHVLELLDASSVKASIFVEGHMIDTASSLIKEFSSLGHEIGYHWEQTEYLSSVDSTKFKTVSGRRRQQLQELTGRPCNGFRAPIFSVPIASKTDLALFHSTLAEIGFKYSSSLILSGKRLSNLVAFNQGCFRWPSGLIEIPVPSLLDKLALPFLGGIYFRYLPRKILNSRINSIRAARPNAELWTYFHPYDFDWQEGYVRFPHRGAFASALLSANRKRSMRDLEWLLKRFRFNKPFLDRLEEISSRSLPAWDAIK